MVERGHRGTYVPKPLLLWRRHEGGSKNPASRGEETTETVRIRARHTPLLARAYGLPYAVDRAVGLADRLFGISRSQRLLAACERASWRRFLATE
jgi:hypothetical protein